MTDTNKLNFLPKLADLAAAGIAAGAAAAFGGMGSPAGAATEQLVSQMVGKVSAGYFDITNDLTQTDMGVSEKDLYVGALRAGYSLQQKRSNNRVMMDGLGGTLASVAGAQLAEYLKPTV